MRKTLPNGWLPLGSLVFLAGRNGPADFGIHWFGEPDLFFVPKKPKT